MKNNISDAAKRNILTLFNVALPGALLDFHTVNSYAIRLGYLVHPDACTAETLAWLKCQMINYNSTFYKSWNDVTSKTRLELAIDQILHYATTYGTGFTSPCVYMPNDGEDIPQFEYDKFKVIMPATYDEVFERVMTMLNSGIALKPETVEILCTYIREYADSVDSVAFTNQFNIDEVNNKEARIVLYDMFKMSPKDKFELIRYMVYKATNSAVVIKDRATLNKIRNNSAAFDFRCLNAEQLKELASIFYRYKDIILMFKNPTNSKVINKIRRMATKYHTPMTVGYWEQFINNPGGYEETYEKSAELTNFKIVTLLQAINEKCMIGYGDKKMYLIRNGKCFVKPNEQVSNKVATMYVDAFRALQDRLIENLRQKAGAVRLPKGLNLVCPTSEKNFIGNIPLGSSFDMGEHSIVGIHWDNQCGTYDFDLHYSGVDGTNIGWCASYYRSRFLNDRTSHNVIYSGDVTYPDPEATELMYMAKDIPNGIINACRYSGTPDSQFKFFFATEDLADKKVYNYMVDPTKINVETMVTSKIRETLLGVVADGRFYFSDIQTGDGRIPTNRTASATDFYNIFVRKANAAIDLKYILEQAGFIILNDDEEAVDDIKVYNLQELSKDTIINLFA